jgi:hypothetical protein
LNDNKISSIDLACARRSKKHSATDFNYIYSIINKINVACARRTKCERVSITKRHTATQTTCVFFNLQINYTLK